MAGKIHFTNSIEEMEQYVDKSQIVAEMGGDNPYHYEYIEPKEDENARLSDTETREKLEEERAGMIKEYERLTLNWISGTGDKDLPAQRTEIANKLRAEYWALDPYIRARSIYDRLKVLQPGGKVDWTQAVKPADRATTAANGNASSVAAGVESKVTDAAAGVGEGKSEGLKADGPQAATVAAGVEDKVADQAATTEAAPNGAVKETAEAA